MKPLSARPHWSGPSSVCWVKRFSFHPRSFLSSQWPLTRSQLELTKLLGFEVKCLQEPKVRSPPLICRSYLIYHMLHALCRSVHFCCSTCWIHSTSLASWFRLSFQTSPAVRQQRKKEKALIKTAAQMLLSMNHPTDLSKTHRTPHVSSRETRLHYLHTTHGAQNQRSLQWYVLKVLFTWINGLFVNSFSMLDVNDGKLSNVGQLESDGEGWAEGRTGDKKYVNKWHVTGISVEPAFCEDILTWRLELHASSERKQDPLRISLSHRGVCVFTNGACDRQLPPAGGRWKKQHQVRKGG